MYTITLTKTKRAFPYPPTGSKIHITDKIPQYKTQMILSNFKGHRGMGDVIVKFYSGKGSLTDIKSYDAGHNREIFLMPDYKSYFISLNPDIIYPSEELTFDLHVTAPYVLYKLASAFQNRVSFAGEFIAILAIYRSIILKLLTCQLLPDDIISF
jgi:hypothetical protein